MSDIAALRTLLPVAALVTLNYEDCEPEPITGHKITKYNGPQIRLGTRWYYLYQLKDGRALLERWRDFGRCLECGDRNHKAAECDMESEW